MRRAMEVLGVAHARHRVGDLAAAVLAYREAIRLCPTAEAHNNLGVALATQGKGVEAEDELRRALDLKPDYAEAHCNLGNVLKARGAIGDAAESYQRALAVRPQFPEALHNLGNCEAAAGKHDAAIGFYRQALRIAPDYISAHVSLGAAFQASGRWSEAEAALHEALRLAPDHVMARFNFATLLLLLGRLSEAWPMYEARWLPGNRGGPTPPPLQLPMWRGESLQGKRILVWREQGNGDMIQAARYVPMLRSAGARSIGLVVSSPLKPLLAGLLDADALYAPGDALGAADYDCWVYPLSLPAVFRTTLETVPARLPYLHAPPAAAERWRERLERGLPREKFRIGLAWKGFAGHVNDRNRSLPGVADLAPLWTVAGTGFVSLQKGRDEDEAKAPPPGQPMLALGHEIMDFADLASVIDCLDLVITVDTAVAHLAGAMGKPVWVMLPLVPDWRWLLNRADSPWYPEIMRLFRQTRTGDWVSVVSEVAAALGGRVARGNKGVNGGANA